MAALRASAACERQHLTVSAAYAHQLEDKQHRLLDCRRQLTPVDSVKERERAMKCKMMIRRRSRKRPGEKASGGMKDFLRWRSRIGAHFIHAELIASSSSLSFRKARAMRPCAHSSVRTLPSWHHWPSAALKSSPLRGNVDEATVLPAATSFRFGFLATPDI